MDKLRHKPLKNGKHDCLYSCFLFPHPLEQSAQVKSDPANIQIQILFTSGLPPTH